MPKLDNYMTRDFDVMRLMLKIVLSYGCYTPKEISELFGISEYKYKENVLRLYFAIGKDNFQEIKKGKSKILSLKAEAYKNIDTLLTRAYKMKCGTQASMDISLMILQMMSDGKERCVAEICDEINRTIDCSDTSRNRAFENLIINDKDDEKNILNEAKLKYYMYAIMLEEEGRLVLPNRKKKKAKEYDIDDMFTVKTVALPHLYKYLNNLIRLGFIKNAGVKKKGNNRVVVRSKREYDELTKKWVPMNTEVSANYFVLEKDILAEIKNRDIKLINELYDILHELREDMPMKVLACMLQESLASVAKYEANSADIKSEKLTIEPKNWITMLDDEVMLYLMYAWEEQKTINFTHMLENGIRENVSGIPYRVFVDEEHHIQYAVIEIEGKLTDYRIDRMYAVDIEERLNLYHEIKNMQCSFLTDISHKIKNTGSISKDILWQEYEKYMNPSDGPSSRYCKDLFDIISSADDNGKEKKTAKLLKKLDNGEFTTAMRRWEGDKDYPVAVPVMLTEYEKRYLKTVMLTVEFKMMASEALQYVLSEVLEDVKPFKWNEFIWNDDNIDKN